MTTTVGGASEELTLYAMRWVVSSSHWSDSLISIPLSIPLITHSTGQGKTTR